MTDKISNDNIQQTASKLKHLRSDKFAEEAEKEILKDFEKKVKSEAGRRLKSAFLAGFLASRDSFNSQTPYCMEKRWFVYGESDIKRKMESTILQISNDLEDDYKRFLEDEEWYNKSLGELDLTKTIRSKKKPY